MWETKFDSLLNQVYYVSDDGTVSFDLPCEVQNLRLTKTRSGILGKISSKLCLIRSKSNSCDVFRRNSRPTLKSSPSDSSSQTAVNSELPVLEKTTSSLYFDNVDWHKTAMERLNLHDNDDMSSVSSVDLIESFYSELPNDIHDDYSIYDKELERHELRQQFIRELY